MLNLITKRIDRSLNHPAILLGLSPPDPRKGIPLTQKSTHSIPKLSLCRLFRARTSLLAKFKNRPLTTKLTLPITGLPLLMPTLGQTIHRHLNDAPATRPDLAVSLIMAITSLKPSLFRRLGLLRPCNVNGPAPGLLVRGN